ERASAASRNTILIGSDKGLILLAESVEIPQYFQLRRSVPSYKLYHYRRGVAKPFPTKSARPVRFSPARPPWPAPSPDGSPPRGSACALSISFPTALPPPIRWGAANGTGGEHGPVPPFQNP